MKTDKNFKLNKTVKRMIASSRMTTEQSNVFKKMMITAQISAGIAQNQRFKIKADDTDS